MEKKKLEIKQYKTKNHAVKNIYTRNVPGYHGSFEDEVYLESILLILSYFIAFYIMSY